jgi:predicted RNA binding protein YcfA (HicA-like mRNA interferase family)
MSAVTILSDPCVALGTTLRAKTGSHIRLSSNLKGTEHHVTIPNHKQLRIGTLAEILGDVANYLDLTREELTRQLFG